MKICVGDCVCSRILLDHGVNTIDELCCMTGETKQLIIERGKMSATTLVSLQNNVKDALVGDAPSKVDHKKAVNTYESRYGDALIKEIVQVRAFKLVKCISEMVTHCNE
jgi:hypothetical protein